MTDPIKHVVLLMLENHSFDQMLGCFKEKYPALEGVDPLHLHTNTDARGKVFAQKVTEELQMSCDPYHDHPDVMEQMAGGNSGFIKNFITHYPSSSDDDRQDIMGYYPRGFLPALHALAEDFLICDHWHSSLPGPTWPNRFFALSGTCNGRVEMPAGWKHPDFSNWVDGQNQDTLFDRLTEAKRSWLVYYYDVPDSLIFAHQRRPENLSHYRLIDQFFKDCRDESTFPDFTFIEPKYFGLDQNDDHPPHNLMKAEKLIADVYNALRSNDALWESTLLVILYDEHGGFYDHVTPPPTVAPDDKTTQYAFNQLGVRVPALLVSPWVKRGFTGPEWIFDHTSLLKYLTDKWNLGSLGNRTAQAKSFAGLIEGTPRNKKDTVPFIRVSYTSLMPQNPTLEKMDKSVHHQALHSFANYLEEKLDEGAAKGIADLGLADSARLKIKSETGRILGGFLQHLSTAFEGWRTVRQRRTETVVKRYMGSKSPEARVSSRILFLDFDGVLNNELFLRTQRNHAGTSDQEDFDPQNIEALNTLCASGKISSIVITSTWRVGRSLDVLRKMLTDAGFKFSQLIEAATPVLGTVYESREKEIREWLAAHSPTDFIVLDDWDFTATFGSKTFHVAPTTGLTREMVDRLLAQWG